MPPRAIPPPPERVDPDPAWEHVKLWRAIRNAVYTLPSRFQSDLLVSGVLAPDLFAFNASLGATIEEQVIAALNQLRSLWDPDQTYALYSFERQPQTFPDVVLRSSVPNVEPCVLMGIELKGWYVLSKESEPSFRYRVTPAVCAPEDILVVVPWALSNVISGSPRIFQPFVIGARHAAEYRNWYWEHAKGGKGDNTIALSTVTNHYPAKSDMIADRPVSDSGGNFGRLARARVMDDYISELFEERLAGIPLVAWQKFLGLFTEGRSTDDVLRALDRLTASIAATGSTPAISEKIEQKFREIVSLLFEG